MGRAARPLAPLGPRPPDCADHGGSWVKGCDGCKPICRWRSRRAYQQKVAGTYLPSVPVETVREHLRALRAANLSTYREIGDRAGVARSSVRNILTGPAREKVSGDIAAALLSIPVPERPLPPHVRTPRPGLPIYRMLCAMNADGYSREYMAGLGDVHYRRIEALLRATGNGGTVTLQSDDVVRRIYDKVRYTKGPSSRTASRARRRGLLGSRCWTDETIEDPTFDPHAQDAKPWRARRRLHAMIAAGYGVPWLSEETGVPVPDLRRWICTGSSSVVPQYALPLMDHLYRQYAQFPGPDQQAADQARRDGWGTFFAWEGSDVDGYARRTMPTFLARQPEECHPLVVDVAINGGAPAVELTAAERLAAVRTLSRRGWTPVRIGRWLRWSADPDAGAAAVTALLHPPAPVRRRKCRGNNHGGPTEPEGTP